MTSTWRTSVWALGALVLSGLWMAAAPALADHPGLGPAAALRKPAMAPAPGPGLFADLAAPAAASSANGTAMDAAGDIATISRRTGIAARVISRTRPTLIDADSLAGLVPKDLPLVRQKSPLAGAPMRLALFADADIWVSPTKVDLSDPSMIVWSGKVVGHDLSAVSLVIKDGRVVGDVAYDGKAFHIRPTLLSGKAARASAVSATTDGSNAAKDGAGAIVHDIVEVDDNAYRHGPTRKPTQPLPSGLDVSGRPDTAGLSRATATTTTPQGTSVAGSSVPILMAYTTTAAAQASSNGSDIKAVLANAVNTVNTIWTNSGVNAQLAPTYYAIDSTVSDQPGIYLADFLNFVSGFYVQASGYGRIRQARDAAGAALVELIAVGTTDDPACGIAFVPDRPVVASSSINAFSAVSYGCLGTTNAHEIGHNMSLNHDRTTDSITDQSVYNVGWIDPSVLTRDVMSYPNPCSGCRLQRLYSNPNLTVNGAAFGVAPGGNNPSFGAQAVNESVAGIQSYRASAIQTPDANQMELAVNLTASQPSGQTAIANAQPGIQCTPTTNNAGTVWFTWTPTISGSSSFIVDGATGSDRFCVYQGRPTGTVKQTATGSESPDYYPAQFLRLAKLTTASVQGVATATANQPIYLGINSSNATTAAPIKVRAATAMPQNGWWYDPAYGGIGFAIETGPPSSGGLQPRIFVGGFFYEAGGAPVWGIALGDMQSPTSYSGPLQAYAGGNPFGSPTKSAVNTSSYTNIALNFTSPTRATLTWAGGTLNLQRYIFDSTTLDPTAATPADTGWYWVNNDGGRGMFVEQQGNTLFTVLFHYTASGNPFWQVATATRSTNGVWTGNLTQYSGGTTVNSPFRAATAGANPLALTVQGGTISSNGANPLYNPAAPANFPATYYSASALQYSWTGLTSGQPFQRFRF